MASNASTFVRNRVQPASITNTRLLNILWYIVECYNLLLNDKPSYSVKHIGESTSMKFEDYLKAEFVDKYLIKQKSLLKQRVSELEHITFNYETQKRYIDASDGKEKPDKIDIYINKLGLQNEWNDEDEHIYFALECKRLVNTSSYNGYINDIQKFTDRKHTNLRLPFEGMLAFIEAKSIDHKIASSEILKRLEVSSTIKTTEQLTNVSLHDTFDGAYMSVHQKNYAIDLNFKIYHLMFDYSQIVSV